jgi:hypothetical protein
MAQAKVPAAQTTSPSVDANWNCVPSQPSVAGVAGEPLKEPITVGQKIVLACTGDSVNLKSDQLRLELRKEDKYALKILETQSIESTKGVFTVTSYRVGEGEIKGVVLTDGTLRVALNNVNFKVKSVIEPMQNPEGKAYSPSQPVGLLWPSYVWIVLASLVALVVLIIVNAIQKSAQKRKLLRELSLHGSALSPYQLLNKEMRALNRNYQSGNTWDAESAEKFISSLEQSFRWFLTREFVIPAHQWRPAAIVKELKRKNKVLAKQIDKDLRLTLRELDKGKAASARLTLLDANQILELCRKVADRIHNFKKEKKSA